MVYSFEQIVNVGHVGSICLANFKFLYFLEVVL